MARYAVPAGRTPNSRRLEELRADSSDMNDGTLLLGLECGGTRTVALATNASLKPVGRVETGPCNLRLVTDAELEARFRELAGHWPRPAAVGIGMAGVRDADDCARIERIVERVWPGAAHQIDHDLESALAAAELEGGRPGLSRVIVLSGTGSCCYGRNARDQTAKVGGWGHLLGDRGSAYDIAFRALRSAAHAFDHTGKWGRFGQHALRQLQLNEPNDLIAWLQAVGKTEVAALAPAVFAAAQEGDRNARQVLTNTADILAGDALACARRLRSLRSPVRFVLTGSVLLRQVSLARDVGRRIRSTVPHAVVSPLGRDSVWGAVVMAQRALGSARAPYAPVPPEEPRPSGVSSPVPRSRQLSPTEQRNPRSNHLDRMPLVDAIDLMLDEEARISATLRKHRRQLKELIQRVVKALECGGRLFYVGAGTSGRLGVLDASECPPTFRTPPDWIQGIMAGGERALHSAVEGAEDDLEAGRRAMEARRVGPRDVVVGLAASGRTPFVWGALAAARSRKATTGLICFNPYLEFAPGQKPDVVLAVNVGPEVLTGSTRLKAGTATKLILNTLTTLTMVRLGKVRSNLMVDLNPSNAKLRDRACRMVMELTGVDRPMAESALIQAGWVITTAVKALGRR